MQLQPHGCARGCSLPRPPLSPSQQRAWLRCGSSNSLAASPLHSAAPIWMFIDGARQVRLFLLPSTSSSGGSTSGDSVRATNASAASTTWPVSAGGGAAPSTTPASANACHKLRTIRRAFGQRHPLHSRRRQAGRPQPVSQCRCRATNPQPLADRALRSSPRPNGPKHWDAGIGAANARTTTRACHAVLPLPASRGSRPATCRDPRRRRWRH